MSRKWNEAPKPVQCKNCKYSDKECGCKAKGHPLYDLESWRYCKAYIAND